MQESNVRRRRTQHSVSSEPKREQEVVISAEARSWVCGVLFGTESSPRDCEGVVRLLYKCVKKRGNREWVDDESLLLTAVQGISSILHHYDSAALRIPMIASMTFLLEAAIVVVEGYTGEEM